ncbi:MAG: phosphoribosylamine--glycine ligase [Dehalococcoidales bacterium]|nr:phosphoribosylamine--glycine ligase [Dehalococcoidales bacterium]
MKILVIGGGGREHALTWKIVQSSKAKEIFVAPGNAGTAKIAQNINFNATDIDGLLKFARTKNIDMVVVGPEGPLSQGIVDKFQAASIPIFGPNKLAAEIESSKVFSKNLMQKYGIPCAKSVSFSNYVEAKKYLETQHPPVVIKADGLAAGKGVVVARTIDEAMAALNDFMDKRTLGAAGNKIIVEEFLDGKEISTFAFTDGNTIVPMVPACDYKTVFEGGRGPNTGGMGSYSPSYFYTPALAKTIQDTIMAPTVKALDKEGRPYKSVLYGGLMVDNNQPKVLEFNARFGDPETEVILPRLKTDLVEIMLAVINNRLFDLKIEWSDNPCVGVVMASGGYPGTYKTGLPINGLNRLANDITVFHAGTKLDASGKVVTSGGRVLVVTASGKSIAEAREKVYNNISLINFEGCHYRKDIALIKED